MTVSTEIEPPLQSAKSSNLKFLVQIQIAPHICVEFVLQDTKEFELLDSVDIWGSSISVETVIHVMWQADHAKNQCSSLARVY